MEKKLLLVFCLILLGGVAAMAQTRQITNLDLDKYKQQRLAAEKDYRENYESMGFPSPEELDKQIEKSKADLTAMAEKLRAERLERERTLATPVYYYYEPQPTPVYDNSLSNRDLFYTTYATPRRRYYNYGNGPTHPTRPTQPNQPNQSRPVPQRPTRWLPMN